MQIVKALLMNDTHSEDGIALAAEELEELLNESVDERSLQSALDEYGHSYRTVVHTDGKVDVVDSCIGTHFQR